jgi:hypothetical protein
MNQSKEWNPEHVGAWAHRTLFSMTDVSYRYAASVMVQLYTMPQVAVRRIVTMMRCRNLPIDDAPSVDNIPVHASDEEVIRMGKGAWRLG